ncbi:MAG TPA: aminotransferase class V-fold PLP-dependent enzyme [Gemmatimonadaceae bacterium]
MTALSVSTASERSLFSIPADVTYLNCASMSPQLQAVTAAGIVAVRGKASPWNLRASDWFVHAEPLRALFARVVGGDAECVALVPSVSYGLAVAAANLPVRAGQTILVIDREFPSNVYAWRELARRTNARLRTVTREPGASWTDAILAALSEGDVALIATPVCHWTDGTLMDLERVGAAARAAGAALVVDASQAAGAHPIDVGVVQPDFLVSVGYKWLMGPYSLGYLYVAPKWHERGVPIEQTWMSRAGAEDFARLVDYTDELRPGARRFDMGEFSQFNLLPMATAALEQVLDWGVERVARDVGALTTSIARDVAALGCIVADERERVRHMLGVQLPGGLPAGLADRLAAARVFVSIRGDSIRVAPHLYNDERDVQRLVSVLEEAIRS